MRGLLLKDWYTLIKQMKIILLILVVFACVPGYSLPAFAVLYASMLPVTALAYDERSKWNDLAVMMPYSDKDIVLSKYILGLLAVAAATLLSLLAQLVLSLINAEVFDFAQFASVILIACLSLILLALNLPLMYKLGVEKGRIALMILICAGVMGSMALRDALIEEINSLPNISVLLCALVLITVVIYIVSMFIAVGLFRSKKA